MSLKCRVFRDEKGQIDFVNAANGSRSKLFDKLVDMTGGNKNTALNIYALTEVDELKESMDTKLNAFKERLKKIVKVAPSTSARVEDIMFSKTNTTTNPTYFSNALGAISNLTDKNPKNTQGWIKQLTDTQKNGGIKNVNQELEWIGLEDYLTSYVKENSPKAGNIPASVVEDYIKSNQIEIVDVSKGNVAIDRNTQVYRDELLNQIYEELINISQLTSENEAIIDTWYNDSNNENYMELFNMLNTNNLSLEYIEKKAEYNLVPRRTEVKYEGYQLSGGENYREVLLTMPAKTIENDKVFTVKNRKDFWKEPSNFSAKEVEEGFLVSSVRGGRKLIEKDYYIKTEEDAINSYREDNLQLLDIFSEEQGVEDYDFYDENGEYFNTSTAVNIGQAITSYKEQTAKKQSEYTTSHWNEKNILAHLRMNEKTLADGRKILVVNEVQSDWAQEGRKKGFKNKNKQKERKELVLKIEKEKTKAKEIKDKIDRLKPLTNEEKAELNQQRLKLERVRDNVRNNREWNALGEEITKIEEKLDEYQNTKNRLNSEFYTLKYEGDASQSVLEEELYNFDKNNEDLFTATEDMPYKNTDQWLGLATRRVLQMAVQEGYDGVSFATGQQSADMYSLAKQVDYIKKQPESFINEENNSFDIFISMPDGTLSLEINRATGVILGQTGNARSEYTGKNLEDVIGKEMSKKLMSLDEKEHTLQGEDLEIGGEGMKTFYDSIVTKVAQKEAQRFDKNARLEEVNFDLLGSANERIKLLREEKEITTDNVRYAEIQKEISDILDSVRNESGGFGKDRLALARQPFIAITDKMRSELGKAIPMFSKNQGQEAPREVLDQVTDRLEQSGLANNVYKMTNSEIEAKLIELGVSAEIAKQVTLSEADVESTDYNSDEEYWEVYLKDGSYLEVYLPEDSTENEVKKETVALIKEYLVENIPSVYRGINGEFSSDYKGVQYFAVQKRYAGVFGRNIEEFKIKSPDILDLDDWNKKWGVEKIDFGQGLLTVHQDNLSNLKEWRTRIKNSLLAVGVEVSKEELDSFIKEVEDAKIIKGEDIGNTGQIVFAVKDKSLVEPINKDIQFSKTFYTKPTKKDTRLKVIKEALKIDKYTPELEVAAYFLSGGRVSEDAIKKLYRNSKGEVKARMSLISKTAPSINEIAHSLWQNSEIRDNEGESTYTDQDYVNFIEDLLSSNNTRKSIAEEVIRPYQVENNIPEEAYLYLLSDEYIESQIAERESAGEVEYSKIELTTAGFTYKGDVYLNTDAMGLDTPIHEFGHLHLDWLKENRNDLYKAGLSLVDKNKEEAQQYIDIVKETQPDLVEGSEKFINEVLAQVIGDQGAKLVNSKKEGSIADWLKSVWESIKDILGLTSYTADEVANMTLADFGKASATEMLSGSRIQRGANTTNSDINFSVLSDYRDNNRFAYSDLIYPDVVFKDINKPQDVKTATNFYKKIIAKFNKTFDRDLKIETSEKSNDFTVTVEYETGLRPKYFAYPTAVMGEHSTVNDIDKNVPLTSLRHELIHEMLVKNITDKFERINNLDNSANIKSIEEVQRNRAYNYTLEDVFFERVVENIERNPDNKDTFEVSTFGTDVINALKKELGDEAISKEKVISTLKTLLEGSNSWLSSTLLEIFENRLDFNVEDLSDLADSLGEKFKTKFVASKDIFSKELQEKINDFTKFFNEEYTGVLTRLGKQKAKPQDIVSGNKLFNEPLEEAAIIANEYIEEKGMDTTPIQKITKLDTDNSKRIAEEFDKMEVTPNNPETKASYKAMVNETLEQYEKIINKGYKVEINNLEPYDSSADMIKDLRENKSMRIFSTESGFGDEPITDKQRRENPLLEKTQYKDINGVPLLANDIFRFVHDFFGHAKFGNGFGAIGEENAWNVHSRMYSPLARRAMTTETRGQNSWVNFSGVNDEAFKKRDRARVLRQQGKLEEAAKLTEEVYEEMSFAEQKVGLLPEWVSTPYEQSVVETVESPETTLIETRQPSLEVDRVKIFAKDRANPITGEKLDGIEWELIESSDKGKGNARKAANTFLQGTDAQGKDVYLTVSPRDNNTKTERLEAFYSSLGFEKTSDFEMVRRAKKVSLKETDSNGEPSIKTLMDFSNSKVKPLGLEGIKAAKNAAMALKVKSSQELIEKMEKALMKNGIVLFDKLSLQRSKLYNSFEINTILSSPKLQKQIKESLLALRNSESFTIEYDENFIVPQGREVNQFGKQEVINPNVVENDLMQSVAGLKESEIDEALPTVFTNKYYTDSDFRETVDTIARDYKKAPIKNVIEEELTDKTEDVEGMLENTITDNFNDTLSEDIKFLREEIGEEVFDSNLKNVSKVLNKIKKNAYFNGIDLRNLPTLALELSRAELLGFLDSMENAITNTGDTESLREFSDMYYEVLGDKEDKTEIIRSESENDIVVEEPLSDYQMFSKFGLVKKDEGIYRQVKEESLDTLYDNFFEYKNLLPEGIATVENLKSYVQKNANQLEVSDYEIDVDNLEKMFLYKKFFDFPMSTQKSRVTVDDFNKITNSEEYLTDVFVKDFNKWILTTSNTYFKVTNKGIELVNNDELSKVEAVNSVPERFLQELAEYNIISENLDLELPLPEERYEDINTQLEQRQRAVNNPDRVKKVAGQYTYLKGGVLAVKNESETFVKTPIGIFEKIFEFENVKFYGKLNTDKKQGYKKVNLEAPFSDINFKDYMYLANSPESFKTSKNYYSTKELNDINEEYFGCQ